MYDWPALYASADFGDEEQPPGPVAKLTRAPAEKVLCKAHVASTGEPCKNPPVAGAVVCHAHGARAPQVKEAAARRVQEQRAWEVARQIAPAGVDVERLGDPVSALEWGIAYSRTLAMRLAKLVDAIPDDQLRYAGRLGEQVRGELSVVQRALADLNSAADKALRVGLAERKVRIDERRAELVEKAMMSTLAAAGLDEVAQRRARRHLAAQLRELTTGG